MRLKIQKSLIVLFLLGLFLYGCVDEPYIEPVKRPFSVIRVGNFTSNVDPLTVLIDGKKIGDLAANTITNYFDVKSGQRLFTLKDGAGNTIYNKNIPVISYEEETIVFGGYYSAVDTLNTFAFFNITDGFTYKEETPPADSSQIYFINCITDTPTDTAKKVAPAAFTEKDTNLAAGDTLIIGKDTVVAQQDTTIILASDTLASAEAIGFGKYTGFVMGAGTYNFGFLSENSAHAVVKDATISANKRYYFFIGGTPKAMVITMNEENPLPARSK